MNLSKEHKKTAIVRAMKKTTLKSEARCSEWLTLAPEGPAVINRTPALASGIPLGLVPARSKGFHEPL
jgi:hypothetical protein